jgi:hypothetical protein
MGCRRLEAESSEGARRPAEERTGRRKDIFSAVIQCEFLQGRNLEVL